MIFFLPRANDICFLGCIRSLNEAKAKVIAGLYKWKNKQVFFSDESKHLSKIVKLPNPVKNEKKFLKKIIRLKKNYQLKDKIFYLPTSDTNMMVAANNWDILSNHFYILGNKNFSKPNKNVFCKMKMFKILNNKKIDTPYTSNFTKKNFLKMQKKYKNLMIKPRIKDYAQSFYKKNIFKAVQIDNLDQFNIFKKRNRNLLKDLIIQQKIEFRGVKHELPIYVYVNKDHKIIFSVCGVKHFIFPENYGSAGILGITDNKEILDIAKKIVKIIKWRGILMIEFIYDFKEKKWNVIEMNGRPWLMIDFFRRLDFSFLKLLIFDFLNLDLRKILKEFELNKKKHIKKKSIHIDLSILNEAIKFDKNNYSKIMKIINQTKSFSISTLDHDDKNPFLKEVKSINKKLNSNINY